MGAHGKGLREGDWKGLEEKNRRGNTVNLFQLNILKIKFQKSYGVLEK